MEGPTQLNHYLIPGLSGERKSWCGVHPVWKRAQVALRDILGSVSIGQLAHDTTANLWKHPQLMAPEIRGEAQEGA